MFSALRDYNIAHNLACSQKNLLWLADLEKESIGQNLTFDKVVNEFDAAYD